MSELTISAEQQIAPIPARFWWFKRICFTLVVLLIALGFLRWWWGVKASKAWEAEIGRYRATGEPLFPEDFDQPAVPDAENAALLLQQAANGLSLTSARPTLMDDIIAYPDRIKSEQAQVKELLEANGSIRELVHRTSTLKKSNWGFRWQGAATPVPNFRPYFLLSKLLIVAAISSHEAGRDEATIDCLRDAVSLGPHLETYKMLVPSLIDGQLVQQVGEMIENVGLEIRIATEPLSNDTSTRANPNQIKALIADLLDDQAASQGKVMCFYKERTFQFSAVQMAVSGSAGLWSGNPNWEKPIAFVFRPAFQLDGIRMLKRATILVEAASAPTRPAAKKLLNTIPPVKGTNDLRGRSRILSEMVTPNFSGTVERWFESLARRRMAAVALAIRLYQAEHHQLPPSLDALVPNDIPAIPIDPLADDGRKIQYESDKDRPSLYCTDPRGSIRFYLSRKRPAMGSRQS